MTEATYLTLCIFAVVSLVGLLHPYVINPITIKKKHNLIKDAPMKPLDPETLSLDVRAFFDRTASVLVENGFSIVGYKTKDASAKVSNAVVYLVNRSNGDMATIACIYVKTATHIKVRSNMIFLMRLFSNGSAISTCSLPESTSRTRLKSRPYVTGYRFSQITDPVELYNLHQFVVDYHSKDFASVATIPQPGLELQAFADYDKDVFDYQVKSGILRVNETGTHYLPTWYGAVYLTWSGLFPFKQIRKWKQDGRDMKMLREYYAQKPRPYLK